MSVEVQCGRCGRKYILATEHEGSRARCVNCNCILDIVDRHASIDAASNDRKSRLRLAALILTAAVGIIIASMAISAAIVLPGARGAFHLARRERCRNNMEHIAFALLQYAHAHGGQLPEHPQGELFSLSLLYPDYADSPSLFACPAAPPEQLRNFPEGSSLTGHPCSYRYTPPDVEIPADPGAVIVAEPPGIHHEPGGYIIMMDGRVEWFDPREVAE